MANTLGQLIVRLSLDANEFVSGMTKAEAASQRLARNLDRELGSAAKLVGISIGAIAGGALIAAKNIISEAAALDDLADSTGSSVESLSRLSNQAKISGTDFGTLQTALNKLSVGLAGVDEEGTKTSKALKVLGVTATDPAEALQQVAVSLNKYADGSNKAAIAVALFGKGGAALLPLLKDIAELQNVAATTTTKQAQEAEKLEKAIRALSVSATDFKNAVLSYAVPALNTFIEYTKEAIKIAGGFGSALATVGTVDLFKSPRENIEEFTKEIDYISQNKSKFQKAWDALYGLDDEGLRKRKIQKEFELFRERQQALAGAAALGYTGDVRDYLANKRPDAPKLPLDIAAGKTKVDEFARALEAVSKMAAAAGVDLKAAFSGEQILPAQRALATLMADDVWNKFTQNQKDTIKFAYEGVIATEKQTQQLKDERAEREKLIKTYEDLAAAEAKAAAQFTEHLGRYAEENKEIERSISLIGADDAARQRFAATLQKEKLIAEAIAARRDDDVKIIEEQFAVRIKLINTMDALNKKFEESLEYGRLLKDSFAGAFTDFITGAKSASEAMKEFERSLVQALSNKASGVLADALFGKPGSSSSAGSWLSNLFSGDLLKGLIPGFAIGTDFAPGGLALVGEHGPEVVNLPRGSQVMPNRRTTLAPVINIHTTVMPGATRQSAQQAAAEMAGAAKRAVASIR